jgi:hypothetical protein
MILFLCMVPGNLRPHVIAGKHIEQFAAYLIAGRLCVLAYLRPRQLFLSCALLSACMAVLELKIPGRASSITDFVVSAFAYLHSKAGSGDGQLVVAMCQCAPRSAPRSAALLKIHALTQNCWKKGARCTNWN